MDRLEVSGQLKAGHGRPVTGVIPILSGSGIPVIQNCRTPLGEWGYGDR